MNNYYIGDLPQEIQEQKELESIIVGRLGEQRILDNGQILVKTPHGKNISNLILDGFKKYKIKDLDEILQNEKE